jgi:integrase
MARRGNGEGSITRRSDGRWHARISVGYSGGKRVRKDYYGKTRAEVVEKLRKAQQQVASGQMLPDETVRVGAYLDWWAENVLAGSVKTSTATGYRWILDTYVRPELERVPVAKLTAVNVQTMMRKLELRGLSPATRRQARVILRRAIGDAVRLGVAAHNPVDAVKPPKLGGSRTDDALTAKEAAELRKAMAGHRFEALFLVALGAGPRKGELLALRWPQVDLDAGTITIQGTLRREKGVGLVIDTPKTTAGYRTVPLPKVCVDALRAHRARQAAERLKAGTRWQDTGHVFTTPIGTPVDPRNLTMEYHRVTVKAGLGKRRMHALRHSAATFMLDGGVDLAIISKTLGHASYSITADVYAHVRDSSLRTAADAMERALGAVADN